MYRSKEQFDLSLNGNGFLSSHMFERGFKRLWDNVPSKDLEETPPPAEFYDQIQQYFYNSDEENLLNSMCEFSTYLYKNGFDDPDEFNEKGMLKMFYQLCESLNVQISQTAFHIFSLLLSRGPKTIEGFDKTFFVDFCFRYLNDINSPLFYYALVCIIDVCGDSQEIRNEIMNRIPIDKLLFLLEQNDLALKESAMDLGFQYTKYDLDDYAINNLINLCEKAVYMGLECLNHSTYCIIIRLLRNYENFTSKLFNPIFINNNQKLLESNSPYEILPGLLFVSYAFEMKIDYNSGEDLNRIVEILSDPPDNNCQKQACLTLIKIVFRAPEKIEHLVRYGIFGQIGFALDHAKFSDKILIGKLACMIIKFGGPYAKMRVLQTKCINLFLIFFDYEEDELTYSSLEAINDIFNATSNEIRFEKLLKRFVSKGGYEFIQEFMESDNINIKEIACHIYNEYLEDYNFNQEEED